MTSVGSYTESHAVAQVRYGINFLQKLPVDFIQNHNCVPIRLCTNLQNCYMEHITWEKIFRWRKDKKMFKDKRDRAKLRLKLQ